MTQTGPPSRPLGSASSGVPSASASPDGDPEQVYYEGSPSLRGQLGGVFLTGTIAVILIAAAALSLIYGWGWPWWAILAAVLIALVVGSIPILTVRALRYRITNYRIDCEHGLLGTTIDTMELWHVEDVQFHQSLLNRMLGVGTIAVISHDDTTPKLIMRGLPHPRPLFETLKTRIIVVKRQRGVIKMDTGT